MTLTRASLRLAACLRQRNEQTHRRALAAANAADRAVGEVWGSLLALLRDRPGWIEANRRVHELFRWLFYSVNNQILSALQRNADWSWRGAVRGIGAAVPRKQLAKVHDGRAVGHSDDSIGRRPITALSESMALGERAELVEDESGPEMLSLQQYLDWLFPPPPADQVRAIIYGNRWQERLAACTRLADPTTLASIVSNGIIQGKSNQEIAKLVLPAVNNVRSSARRIARTESVRVAGAMQMKAHEQLGDLVVGFQLHSMHDHHTRPWHLARDGRLYYKHPQPGQDGLDKMPRPPDEPPDPSERPPGTPSTAWNCRCFITPILRP